MFPAHNALTTTHPPPHTLLFFSCFEFKDFCPSQQGDNLKQGSASSGLSKGWGTEFWWDQTGGPECWVARHLLNPQRPV